MDTKKHDIHISLFIITHKLEIGRQVMGTFALDVQLIHFVFNITDRLQGISSFKQLVAIHLAWLFCSRSATDLFW